MPAACLSAPQACLPGWDLDRSPGRARQRGQETTEALLFVSVYMQVMSQLAAGPALFCPHPSHPSPTHLSGLCCFQTTQCSGESESQPGKALGRSKMTEEDSSWQSFHKSTKATSVHDSSRQTWLQGRRVQERRLEGQHFRALALSRQLYPPLPLGTPGKCLESLNWPLMVEARDAATRQQCTRQP